MKELLKSIMEKFDSDVLSEESKSEIEASLVSIIEDKVSAENVLFAEEQSKLYEEATQAKVKEIVEATQTWKKEVLEKVVSASSELDDELQTKLDSEMKEFKEGLVEKVSDFLDYKLDEKIDDQKLGESAKLAVCEPIVNGILGLLKENYVDVNEDSFELLKKAKTELDSLEGRLTEKTKENMVLSKSIKESKKEEALVKALEGLTPEQTEKARLILEDTEADAVESKWENVKDVVMSEVVDPDDDDDDDDDVDDSAVSTEVDDDEVVDDALEEMKGFKSTYESNMRRD